MPKKASGVLAKPKKTTISNEILIKGARANNLKNVTLSIPRYQLVVVTGVSGSGKSSITMDTLYAEGQRRYVESLSSYARQFLMRMKKPDVDYIKGICPAISIEQKVSTSNARSTVGSLTEVYDYLRLLYARIGKTFSPVSGQQVRRHEIRDAVDFIFSFEEGEKVRLFIPLQQKYQDRTLEKELNLLLQKGYVRVEIDGELLFVEDLLESKKADLKKTVDKLAKKNIRILIDRFSIKHKDEDTLNRAGDSVQTAFYESEGECIIEVIGKETKGFNNRFELDGILFVDPTPQFFNYNNPFGACPQCEGYGRVMGIDEEKVIPLKSRSVYEGAIACWSGEKSGVWKDKLINNAHHFDFPVHKPYQDLTKEEKKLIWNGNKYFKGIHD